MNNKSPTSARYIIPGDIHGCLPELIELMDKLKFDPSIDELICVGDLVERGPDSTGVVRYVQKNGTSVCGNHDIKMIKYYGHQKILSTNKQYKVPMYLSPEKQKVYDDLSVNDLEWLTTLPKKIYLKDQNLLIIHAGVMPYTHPMYQADNVYMYCRYLDSQTKKQVHLNKDFKRPDNSIFWTEVYQDDINIVYGHEVHDLHSPRIETNACGAVTYGIDTGCCFDGHLTALVIDKDSGKKYIEQVRAHHTYYKHREER